MAINGGSLVPQPAARQSLSDTFKRERGHDATFPNSNDRPSLAAQSPRNALVSLLVLQNFVSPKSYIALGWPITPLAAVPKTAIHKESDFATRPCEIRLSNHTPVLAISPKPFFPKYCRHPLFRRAIPTRADRSHDPRTNAFRDVVHNVYLLQAVAFQVAGFDLIERDKMVVSLFCNTWNAIFLFP